jgi:hypothetical protein
MIEFWVGVRDMFEDISILHCDTLGIPGRVSALLYILPRTSHVHGSTSLFDLVATESPAARWGTQL